MSTALLALVRRDLTGSRRGAAILWARALAIAAAAASALLAYSEPGMEEVGSMGATMLVLGLGVASLAVSPALALSALRSEREAGTLDLLFLAGVRPSTLAVGRTLSIFLFLESMVMAALPALALFWYFRLPHLRGLLLAFALLSVCNLALAATVVAISAWSRSAGVAVAATLLVLVVWGLAVFVPAHVFDEEQLALPMALVAAMEADWSFPREWLPGYLWNVALHSTTACVGVVLAVLGLRRRPATAGHDVLMAKLERTRRPLGASRPLSWLAQRGSAGARPGVQAILLVPIAAVPFAYGEDIASVWGLLALWIAPVAAFFVGALQVAPSREKRTWASLASTAMPGGRMLADMLHATVLSALVPAFIAVVLIVRGLPARNRDLGVIALLVAGTGACVLFGALLGLTASVASRSSPMALSLGIAVLVLEPALGIFGAEVVGWTPSAAQGWWALGLGGMGVLGVVLGTWGRVKRRLGLMLVGLALVMGVLALPVILHVAGMTVLSWHADVWTAAFGLPLVMPDLLDGSNEALSQMLVTATVHHLLFAGLLAGLLWAYRETWLGRVA